MSVQCTACGGALVTRGEESSTLVGYMSAPPHDHDNNCRVRQFYCVAGHRNPIAIVRRCPVADCTWRGKTTCFCVPRFVEEWPDVPYRVTPPDVASAHVSVGATKTGTPTATCAACNARTLLGWREGANSADDLRWFTWIHRHEEQS